MIKIATYSLFLLVSTTSQAQHIFSIGEVKENSCQGEPLPYTKDWEKRGCGYSTLRQTYECGYRWQKDGRDRCFFMMVEQGNPNSYNYHTDKHYRPYYLSLRNFVMETNDLETRKHTLSFLKGAYEAMEQRARDYLENKAKQDLQKKIIEKAGVEPKKKQLAELSAVANRFDDELRNYKGQLTNFKDRYRNLLNKDSDDVIRIRQALSRFQEVAHKVKNASLDQIIGLKFEMDQSHRDFSENATRIIYSLKILQEEIEMVDGTHRPDAPLKIKYDELNKILSERNLPPLEGVGQLKKAIDSSISKFENLKITIRSKWVNHIKQINTRVDTLIKKQADQQTKTARHNSAHLASSAIFVAEVQRAVKEVWSYPMLPDKLPLFYGSYVAFLNLQLKEKFCQSENRNQEWMETGCKIVRSEMASANMFIQETLPAMIRGFLGYIQQEQNPSIQKQVALTLEALDRGDLSDALHLYDGLASIQNSEIKERQN